MNLVRDFIPGGKAAGRSPSEFDQNELARGVAVEMEHTPDWRVAREIAMDHLTEDPAYYRKLAAIHLDGVSDKTLIAATVTGVLAVVGGFIAGSMLRKRKLRKTEPAEKPSATPPAEPQPSQTLPVSGVPVTRFGWAARDVDLALRANDCYAASEYLAKAWSAARTDEDAAKARALSLRTRRCEIEALDEDEP